MYPMRQLLYYLRIHRYYRRLKLLTYITSLSASLLSSRSLSLINSSYLFNWTDYEAYFIYNQKIPLIRKIRVDIPELMQTLDFLNHVNGPVAQLVRSAGLISRGSWVQAPPGPHYNAYDRCRTFFFPPRISQNPYICNN